MHPTAFISCQVFFTLLDFHLLQLQPQQPSYIYEILDVGSQDVNGNQYDCIQSTPFHIHQKYKYTGLDFDINAANVDVTMNEKGDWPFSTGKDINKNFDIIISTSALEHDEFFWETFMNMAYSLKPNGFIYINAPSSAKTHRYPIDNWRFLSDAG